MIATLTTQPESVPLGHRRHLALGSFWFSLFSIWTPMVFVLLPPTSRPWSPTRRPRPSRWVSSLARARSSASSCRRWWAPGPTACRRGSAAGRDDLLNSVVAAAAGIAIGYLNSLSPLSGYRWVFGTAALFFLVGAILVSRLKTVR